MVKFMAFVMSCIILGSSAIPFSIPSFLSAYKNALRSHELLSDYIHKCIYLLYASSHSVRLSAFEYNNEVEISNYNPFRDTDEKKKTRMYLFKISSLVCYIFI